MGTATPSTSALQPGKKGSRTTRTPAVGAPTFTVSALAVRADISAARKPADPSAAGGGAAGASTRSYAGRQRLDSARSTSSETRRHRPAQKAWGNPPGMEVACVSGASSPGGASLHATDAAKSG